MMASKDRVITSRPSIEIGGRVRPHVLIFNPLLQPKENTNAT